ncbi:hypothetical protein [Acidithiobacillus ferrivorans]|uniref:hypothetical protein n=1 Tax=Acidithiobacillus ferrivorans TaxID=160808 RepID=UPI00055431CE|nr:hypothetical protein [Acidithiobacillus ferrivorans]
MDEGLGIVGAAVFHAQDLQVLAGHFVDHPPEMGNLAVGKDLQTPTVGAVENAVDKGTSVRAGSAALSRSSIDI